LVLQQFLWAKDNNEEKMMKIRTPLQGERKGQNSPLDRDQRQDQDQPFMTKQYKARDQADMFSQLSHNLNKDKHTKHNNITFNKQTIIMITNISAKNKLAFLLLVGLTVVPSITIAATDTSEQGTGNARNAMKVSVIS
jgi:hypothetical protein